MARKPPLQPASAASAIRNRIAHGGERLWSHSDFPDLPAGLVARTLSRLERSGELERVRKGTYYRSRPTVLGRSRPSQTAVMSAAVRGKVLHPAGLNAAATLGLTTQNPARGEYATTASSAPSALGRARVHRLRPAVRSTLDATDGALLEFLRDRGHTSDVSAEETRRQLVRLVRRPGAYARLAAAAEAEPPYVRAILGALGDEARTAQRLRARLHGSLNPLSRFDFGAFSWWSSARRWQAK
jgi:Transcriptional regulator, AbiEi antitoxin